MRGSEGYTPKYKSVADMLRYGIESGEYPPGSYLPSETELMSIHRVSRVVVRDAVEWLRTQGYIATRKGKGSFVTGWGVHIVRLSPGAVVSARMPSEQERQALNMPRDVPVLVVARFDASGELINHELLPAHATRIELSNRNSSHPT